MRSVRSRCGRRNTSAEKCLPLRRPRRGWRAAGAQAMRPLTDTALKLGVKTEGRSYPTCGCAVWDGGAEAKFIDSELLALAEASPRLAGLLMHRALRPIIKMGKRLGVPREALAQLSMGQASAVTTLPTLCFFARALPEVLDPPEPAPRFYCMQACSVDGHC